MEKYLYTFGEFVEHALRLQAQSKRRLSTKCIDILEMHLMRQLFFIGYLQILSERKGNNAYGISKKTFLNVQPFAKRNLCVGFW